MSLEFTIEKYSATGIEVVSLTFKPTTFETDKGKKIFLSVKSYGSASIGDKTTLFVHINAFLSQLPIETQEAVFAIYCRLEQIAGLVLLPNEVHAELCKLTKTLYELVTYRDIVKYTNYLVLQDKVNVPSNVHAQYTGEYTRERTYLRSDYIELMYYTLALRLMIPFWGYHMGIIVDRTENDYKEKVCFGLTDDTALMLYPAYEKLKTFISHSVSTTKATMATLYDYALSTMEIPEHLLAKAVVRKLAVGTLNPQVDDDSLIRLIYNYVDGTNDRIDSSLNKNIRDKPLISDRDDGEDNSSVLDSFKINQDITDGDKILLEEYMKNPYVLCQNVDPNYSKDKLDQCLEFHKDLLTLEINSKVHIPFVQWVLNRSLPPRALLTVSKDNLIRCFLAAQSILWEWGFEELALLVTATRKPRQDSGFFSQLDSKGKLPKAIKDELDELYPYYRRKSKDEPITKRSNVAINAIDKVSEEILQYEWVPCAPAELLEAVPHVKVLRSISFTNEVRVQMANLFIHIHTPKLKNED